MDGGKQGCSNRAAGVPRMNRNPERWVNLPPFQAGLGGASSWLRGLSSPPPHLTLFRGRRGLLVIKELMMTWVALAFTTGAFSAL